MNTEEIFRIFPTLETEHLLLRQIKFEDAQILFDTIYNDPQVTQYDGLNRVFEVGKSQHEFLLPPFNQTMINKINYWQEGFQRKQVIVWGLELKSNDKLIGLRICEYFSFGFSHVRCKLSKDYWNKGFMTEASKIIFEFLEFNNVPQIIATIDKLDTPTISHYKKLGFSEIFYTDLYLSNKIDLMGGFNLHRTGILVEMQAPSICIFARPLIHREAFGFYEKCLDAMKIDDSRSCAILSQRALEFQPDFIYAIDVLAFSKLKMGDPKGAISEFNKVLKIKPNHYNCLLGRSYAFSDLQKWNEAIYDLKSYLKFKPNDFESWVMLGNYYYQANQFKDSIAAYNEALRINPSDKEARQYKETVEKIYYKP